MIKARSAFIDNNTNFKCCPILINKVTLHNNTLSLIITNNSDNKVCISKDIIKGISQPIDDGSHRINKITLTARPTHITTASQTYLA